MATFRQGGRTGRFPVTGIRKLHTQYRPTRLLGLYDRGHPTESLYTALQLCMGYFFRKSAGFGPFRLNISKSGLGASIGIKGARLTMTPRGTTYITVGSHGFYYRDTISIKTRDDQRVHSSPPPLEANRLASDEIQTAEVSDLVDSSSETLVRHLNERAAMFNPAWIFYPAAIAALLFGIKIMQEPSSNALEGLEALRNTLTPYDSMVAKYGYPSTIVASDPFAIVSVRKASYLAGNVGVVFVPESCFETYQSVAKVLRDQKQSPTLAKQERKKLRPCVAPPHATWQPAEYLALTDDQSISRFDSKSRLSAIKSKIRDPPSIIDESSGPKGKERGGGKNRQSRVKQVWAAADSAIDRVHTEENREAADQSTRVIWGYLFTFGGFGLGIAGIMVHKQNAESRNSRLFYELNESESQKYSAIQQSVNQLSQSHQVWRIQSDSPTWDWKRNAGASSLVRRVSTHVGFSNPPRVETNVKSPSIAVGGPTLYFLPDLILYRERGRFGAVAYNDFEVQHSSTRFIEDGSVPNDAVRVGTTWRYVNKDGGPDRRFNNNSQLPVLQYGTLHFQSSRGLNIVLQTSSVRASVDFANTWREFFDVKRRNKANQAATENDTHVASHPAEQARKVLGVSKTASSEELSAAYRRLAQMYHPDKVAGLAPEFQRLADQRMKEINAAYELLKKM